MVAGARLWSGLVATVAVIVAVSLRGSSTGKQTWTRQDKYAESVGCCRSPEVTASGESPTIRAGIITAKPGRWPELPRPLGRGIVTERCGPIAFLAR